MAPPIAVRDLIGQIRDSRSLNVGIEGMRTRASQFPDSMAMNLVGIAVHPPAREKFDDGLDKMWAANEPPASAQEVIVGAGFHAAVYAAIRVAMGYPKPIVIEQEQRVGGIFAVSRKPTFYLNSPNLPGPLGYPGRGEALNVLPGAPIQPSDLSGDEYQRNSDLAFAIRTSLALNAYVVTQCKVTGQYEGKVLLDGDNINKVDSIKADRVIYATGLGRPNRPGTIHPRILTYSDFMARLDDPFPLRDMKRVAVVGAGDSGRTVIEALIGQGPSTGWSTPSLDWVERIDWYGVNRDSVTREGWEGCNRSRYKGIGRALPRPGKTNRISPLAESAEAITGSYETARVNGRTYDWVIFCGGFRKADLTGSPYAVAGRDIARVELQFLPPRFVIGPAADLSQNAYESFVGNVPESINALFRYADRTATLAGDLPGKKIVPRKRKPPVPVPAFIDDYAALNRLRSF